MQLSAAAGRLGAAPARVGGRLALTGVAVVAVAAVHLRSRPPTLCLLRALTGLPCPFCGGTTAAVAAGHGDVAGALRASPLVAATLVAWPLLGARLWRHRWLVGVALAAAELWQLHRFGLLPT